MTAAVITIGPVFTPHGPDIVEPTHMESPRLGPRTVTRGRLGFMTLQRKAQSVHGYVMIV